MGLRWLTLTLIGHSVASGSHRVWHTRYLHLFGLVCITLLQGYLACEVSSHSQNYKRHLNKFTIGMSGFFSQPIAESPTSLTREMTYNPRDPSLDDRWTSNSNLEDGSFSQEYRTEGRIDIDCRVRVRRSEEAASGKRSLCNRDDYDKYITACRRGPRHKLNIPIAPGCSRFTYEQPERCPFCSSLTLVFASGC